MPRALYVDVDCGNLEIAHNAKFSLCCQHNAIRIWRQLTFNWISRWPL